MAESGQTAAATPGLLRQHLIDPEICIRCNTCEVTCTKGAITHGERNYAIRFDRCDGQGLCLPRCPTGAIESWRRVARPYSAEEQLGWEQLPPDAAPAEPEDAPLLPQEVAEISAEATAGQGGPSPPPWSAAHAYVNLYTPAHPAVATVAGNYRLTAEGSSCDIHHIVLDFGNSAFPVLEGQSVGVLPPGEDEQGGPHHIRLYSVASPRDGERPGYNNLALTVKRITQDHEGRPVVGVASNYLCDLRIGERVQVTGPYGSTFLMPNHPGASLLMICTGTGAAPMRAMTERRRRRMGRKDGGELVLFFGARTRAELPYFGPLMNLPSDFIDVNLAFSRESGQPRQYVQDLIRARSELVFRMLRDENCFIYLCGHKRMEAGVLQAFADICRDHGLSWTSVQQELREVGHLHIETY